MKLPTALLTGDEDEDMTMLRTMNRLTNIIYQSERVTLPECELIMEQIIMELYKKGLLKVPV